MTRLKELEKWDDVKELIFPCDCGGGEYVRITWDEADENLRFLWLEAYSQHKTFKDRIKGAWKIIQGKRYGYADILLTEKTVQKLAKFLASQVEDK